MWGSVCHRKQHITSSNYSCNKLLNCTFFKILNQKGVIVKKKFEKNILIMQKSTILR